MNKTIVFALVLLIGSIMASSYSLAQTDSDAAHAVAAQKVTGVTPGIIIAPSANSGLGWSGTVNAGKGDTYTIAFSTATVTPSSSNNIKESMVVGVVSLYQGDNRVLYKLVENQQSTSLGVKSYLVLPMDASFGNFAEAKSQGIGFLTLKVMPSAIGNAKVLFYLNKGESLTVGKIYVGDVSRGPLDRQHPVIASMPATAKNVNVQSVGSVDSANARPSLIQRILSILRAK